MIQVQIADLPWYIKVEIFDPPPQRTFETELVPCGPIATHLLEVRFSQKGFPLSFPSSPRAARRRDGCRATKHTRSRPRRARSPRYCPHRPCSSGSRGSQTCVRLRAPKTRDYFQSIGRQSQRPSSSAITKRLPCSRRPLESQGRFDQNLCTI